VAGEGGARQRCCRCLLLAPPPSSPLSPRLSLPRNSDPLTRILHFAAVESALRLSGRLSTLPHRRCLTAPGQCAAPMMAAKERGEGGGEGGYRHVASVVRDRAERGDPAVHLLVELLLVESCCGATGGPAVRLVMYHSLAQLFTGYAAAQAASPPLQPPYGPRGAAAGCDNGRGGRRGAARVSHGAVAAGEGRRGGCLWTCP
jgi:hypothetical protein